MKHLTQLLLFSLIIVSSLFILHPLSIHAQTKSAKLLLQPSSSSYAIAEEFWLDIMVDTGTTNVNAVAAHIKYPTNLVEPLKVNMQGSVLTLIAESIAQDGMIKISGGKASPGFQGMHKLGSVGFRVKQTGTLTLSFSSESAIMTNNDNKNILNLNSSTKGVYTLGNPSPQAQQQPSQPSSQNSQNSDYSKSFFLVIILTALSAVVIYLIVGRKQTVK